jgi:hypothetical protein
MEIKWEISMNSIIGLLVLSIRGALRRVFGKPPKDLEDTLLRQAYTDNVLPRFRVGNYGALAKGFVTERFYCRVRAYVRAYWRKTRGLPKGWHYLVPDARPVYFARMATSRDHPNETSSE